jgi:ABC-type branched-subunit amino acid transport system substrate-binding protein/thioredoxin-like negative regulator of GroEL
MYRIHKYICLAVLAVFIHGCVSTGLQPPESGAGPSDAESVSFQQAEQFLASQQWQQALVGFSQYLSRYPQGYYADQAFDGLGQIYSQRQEYDAAQAFYQRLVNEFPDSPLVNKARLAIINLLVLNHQPDEAMAQAQQMLETNPDSDTRRRLWQFMARQQGEAGSQVAAAAYAYMLYQTAPESEKDTWADQLKKAIEGLEDGDIEKIWDQMDDPLARSYLMYRHATLQVAAGNYDEALDVLIAFVQRYPDHPYARDAAQVIATLEKRLSYKPQTLGCLLPLSGPYKAYGQKALNGVELALSLMTSGEQADPIKLVIKDSASDEQSAVQGVRELDQAGVGAIIGPIVAASAAAREAQKLSVPIITMTQKPDITDIGDFVFRHFITPRSQVKALVSYFINTVGLRNFAVMYPRETYGRTFMELFMDEVIGQGGRVVGIEAYDTQQTDFAVPIKKLAGMFYRLPKGLLARSRVVVADGAYFGKHAVDLKHLDDIVPDPVIRLTGLYFQDPEENQDSESAIDHEKGGVTEPIIDFDVLFIPDSPKTAALILPQLAYHDIRDIYLAGTNLWHSPQLIELAKNYAQNAVMVDGFFKESPLPPVRQFVDAYQRIYGSEPGIMEAFAFDTARLMIRLLSRPAAPMRQVLRDAMLQAFEVDGVTGPLAFAPDGEAIKSLSLLRIKGDRFFEIPRQ